MPIKSRWSITIPDTSIVSLLFKSPTEPLSDTTPALIDADDPSRYLTLHTYRLFSQRLAAGLKTHGFKNGDRALLFSGNNIFFPVVFMGVIMAGGIFTGANPSFVARELAYQLKDSQATFLFCSSGSLDTGIEAAAQTDFPKSRIFVFDDTPVTKTPGQLIQGCSHWSKLLAPVEEGKKYAWNPCTTPAESAQTIALNYSSGTTGVPKGVMITHKNYVANTLQTKHMFELKVRGTVPEEIWLCSLPMYHAYGQTFFAVQGPLRSIPIYVMPKFDFEKYMDAIEKYRISRLVLVPPILVAMAKHPQVKAGKWDLSSVIDTGCGAAPLGREVSAEFESLWKGRTGDDKMIVRQGWGMTEVTCSVTGSDPHHRYYTSTIGELLPNCEARIMNDEGTAEVPRGERGELWVRAPNVMKGYWRNEKATRETITEDGWLKSGDICYIDKDGLMYVVDRKKELIKVKGNQVAPAELEALLLEHPAVADAAVIGIPMNDDELPRAYIVLAEGARASAEDITSFLDTRVSRFKRLRGGVRFVDTIPKNPSGKILRKLLRDEAAKEPVMEKARL